MKRGGPSGKGGGGDNGTPRTSTEGKVLGYKRETDGLSKLGVRSSNHLNFEEDPVVVYRAKAKREKEGAGGELMERAVSSDHTVTKRFVKPPKTKTVFAGWRRSTSGENLVDNRDGADDGLQETEDHDALRAMDDAEGLEKRDKKSSGNTNDSTFRGGNDRRDVKVSSGSSDRGTGKIKGHKKRAALEEDIKAGTSASHLDGNVFVDSPAGLEKRLKIHSGYRRSSLLDDERIRPGLAERDTKRPRSAMDVSAPSSEGAKDDSSHLPLMARGSVAGKAGATGPGVPATSKNGKGSNMKRDTGSLNARTPGHLGNGGGDGSYKREAGPEPAGMSVSYKREADPAGMSVSYKREADPALEARGGCGSGYKRDLLSKRCKKKSA